MSKIIGDAPSSDASVIVAQLQALLAPEPRRSPKYPDHLNVIPCVRAVDGLRMSIQASAHHYCGPRDSNGPWHSVEVDFPSRRIEALKPYAEDPKRLTKTVYGWVPIVVVAQVIADHGGLKAVAP